MHSIGIRLEQTTANFRRRILSPCTENGKGKRKKDGGKDRIRFKKEKKKKAVYLRE